VVEQRFGAGPVIAALDLADEDDVVAFLVPAAVEAFEDGNRPVQNRCAARSCSPRNAGETVGVRGREAQREVPLFGSQDVDGVVRAFGEYR
jgi:hypothetical protein